MTIRQLAAGAAAVVLATGAALAADDWQVKTSPYSVEETAERLTDAVEKAGAKVVAVLDHSANAATADMELAPTTVVIFGNPKIGTPLMQENRRIAIDLPVKVLIWQEGDTTQVGYVAPADVAARYNIPADTEAISMMGGALDKLTDAAVAE